MIKRIHRTLTTRTKNHEWSTESANSSRTRTTCLSHDRFIETEFHWYWIQTNSARQRLKRTWHQASASRNKGRVDGSNLDFQKPKNRTKSTRFAAAPAVKVYPAMVTKIFTEKPAHRCLLYMPAFVTKTGTSLPSRTRQFLALQITFRLKRTSPLLPSLFFPLPLLSPHKERFVRSGFQPLIMDNTMQDDGSLDRSADRGSKHDVLFHGIDYLFSNDWGWIFCDYFARCVYASESSRVSISRGIMRQSFDRPS